MSDIYDCIVVGLGAHGSSACARLAKHGIKVLGIEQFDDVVHCEGSSHGKSRVIRQAYFESPKYVPLVKRSFVLWRQYQKEYVDMLVAGNKNHVDMEPLLKMTGGLMIGKNSSSLIKGTLRSVREHNLKHDILSTTELRHRYGDVFKVSTGDIGVLEREAGYLVPEQCITAHVAIAQKYGCETHYGEKLLSWEEIGASCKDQTDTDEPSSIEKLLIKVTTTKGCYFTRKLVLTVGPWAPELYGHVIPNTSTFGCQRRVLFWVNPLESQSSLDLMSMKCPPGGVNAESSTGQVNNTYKNRTSTNYSSGWYQLIFWPFNLFRNTTGYVIGWLQRLWHRARTQLIGSSDACKSETTRSDHNQLLDSSCDKPNSFMETASTGSKKIEEARSSSQDILNTLSVS